MAKNEESHEYSIHPSENLLDIPNNKNTVLWLHAAGLPGIVFLVCPEKEVVLSVRESSNTSMTSKKDWVINQI